METEELVHRIKELQSEMYELSQPRSNFALDHFVVGQHDLPGHQRLQILWELQALMFGLLDAQDEIDLAKIELEELPEHEPNERKRAIKARKLQRKIEESNLYLDGRRKEVIHLLELLDQIPRYTREQFEAEEEEYWKRRLSRQHMLLRMGDPGNLDAFLQLYTLPGRAKPMIADENDILMLFGEISKQLQATNTPLTNS